MAGCVNDDSGFKLRFEGCVVIGGKWYVFGYWVPVSVVCNWWNTRARIRGLQGTPSANTEADAGDNKKYRACIQSAVCPVN